MLVTASVLLAGCGRDAPHGDPRSLVHAAAEQVPVEQTWPGFRGGPLGGVASNQQLPEQWSVDSGVSATRRTADAAENVSTARQAAAVGESSGIVEWKVRLSGRGGSSPVVWDDRILLTESRPNPRSARSRQSDSSRSDSSRSASRRGDSTQTISHEPPSEQLVVVCRSLRDGRPLWERVVGSARTTTHAKNGYASATVATDGGRVFASFGRHGMICCDLEGHLIWRAELGPLEHQWGTASSPVLYADRVIQLADSRSASYLVALDKQNGRELWRTRRESTGSWSTPLVVGTDSGWEIVVNGTGTADGSPGWVIAYDPETGAERWRVRGTTDIPCPSMLFGDGLLVSVSGGNGPILAIRPGGRGDVTSTHLAWEQPRGGPYVPSGVIYRQRLFLVSDGGLLSCYRSADGERVWQKRLGGTYSASLVAGDGKIYAVSEQGDVHVLAAADRFISLASNRLGEPCLATPAIAANRLLLRTENHLLCIGKRTVTAASTPPELPVPPVASPSDRDLESQAAPARGRETRAAER